MQNRKMYLRFISIKYIQKQLFIPTAILGKYSLLFYLTFMLGIF